MDPNDADTETNDAHVNGETQQLPQIQPYQ